MDHFFSSRLLDAPQLFARYSGFPLVASESRSDTESRLCRGHCGQRLADFGTLVQARKRPAERWTPPLTCLLKMIRHRRVDCFYCRG